MTSAAPLPRSVNLESSRPERHRLDAVSDEVLHVQVKALTGRHNALTAELLAHLAEVDARGIYRERACSSLYTYCVYELRLSEDEAQRRSRAARTARAFPLLFEMLTEGAIHLSGLLLLAPHLTNENCADLLARARFRTKREIEHLVAELAPRPDVPPRVEPLGPRTAVTRNSWQAYVASLAGPVRHIASGVNAGEAPPVPNDGTESPAPARNHDAMPLASQRYRVEFTASQKYVELLEEARNLLQHRIPDRDVARVHELAMVAFVEQLRKRRQGATGRATSAPSSGESSPEQANTVAPERDAPERVADAASRRDAPERIGSRYVPAEVRRTIWRRDEGRCTFEDANGKRCPERAGLEIHHEHPFALGGPPTLENLRLLCRAHNALFAEWDFGRFQIRSIVARARGETVSGQAR